MYYFNVRPLQYIKNVCKAAHSFPQRYFFPDSAMHHTTNDTHYAQEPSGCMSDIFFTSVILHLPTTNLRHFAFSTCSAHASNL